MTYQLQRVFLINATRFTGKANATDYDRSRLDPLMRDVGDSKMKHGEFMNSAFVCVCLFVFSIGVSLSSVWGAESVEEVEKKVLAGRFAIRSGQLHAQARMNEGGLTIDKEWHIVFDADSSCPFPRGGSRGRLSQADLERGTRVLSRESVGGSRPQAFRSLANRLSPVRHQVLSSV